MKLAPLGLLVWALVGPVLALIHWPQWQLKRFNSAVLSGITLYVFSLAAYLLSGNPLTMTALLLMLTTVPVGVAISWWIFFVRARLMARPPQRD